MSDIIVKINLIGFISNAQRENEILFEEFSSHLCVSEVSFVERRCTVRLGNQKPAGPSFL